MCCAGAYQRVLFTQLLRNGGYLKGLRVCAAFGLQWLQKYLFSYYVVKMAHVGNSGVIT